MTAIKVDVIMRSNFRETPGGDVQQLEQSLAPLGDRVDVRFVAVTAGMKLRQDAVHHIVNVDRPLDFLSAWKRCGSHVIVSAIHHSLPRMSAMRKAGGADRTIGYLPDPLRERIAFAARASRGSSADRTLAALIHTTRIALDPSSMWQRLGIALDRVSHVVLLAEQERSDLIADTGWSGRNGIVIPNGRPISTANAAPWSDRPRGIIVVGRIEPRKRQMEIAQAAAASGTQITFIGPASRDGYGQRFRDLAAACPSIEWLGPRPASETVALIATARVLLNASWVEVQSLVDIEAATAGCWVVTSPTGSSREWLGPAVDRVDSDDPKLLLERAVRRAAGSEAPPKTLYNHDWAAAGEALFALYSNVGPSQHGASV